MIGVELSEEEWTRLLNAAALAPYVQIAPLLQKVVDQITKKNQQKQEEVK